MKKRLMFIAGLGVGFVLGAKAGRERYEQMRKMARKAVDSPAVQQASDAVQAQAADLARSARDKISDRAGVTRGRVGEALHEHVPGLRTRDSNGRSHSPGEDSFDPAPNVPSDPHDG